MNPDTNKEIIENGVAAENRQPESRHRMQEYLSILQCREFTDLQNIIKCAQYVARTLIDDAEDNTRRSEFLDAVYPAWRAHYIAYYPTHEPMMTQIDSIINDILPAPPQEEDPDEEHEGYDSEEEEHDSYVYDDSYEYHSDEEYDDYGNRIDNGGQIHDDDDDDDPVNDELAAVVQQMQLDNTETTRMCCVCNSNLPVVTFQKCGHLCVCSVCWTNSAMAACPICATIGPALEGRLLSEECVVCLTRQPTTTFQECKHICVCSLCIEGMRIADVSKCPLCNLYMGVIGGTLS